MTPERWKRVGDLYDACFDLDPAARDALLDEECAGDDELRREVEALLTDEPRAAELFDGNLLETVKERLADGDALPRSNDLAKETLLDGRYLIKEKIAEGGMGAVYLAERSHMLDDKVVVKVLLEESLRNEYAVLKFRQEMEALMRVKHAGVVGVFDAGKLPGGAPYLVIEYVAGETLRDCMNNDGMDLRRAASIVRQIGEALSAAHDKGVFHRDLKPNNIMLVRDERGVEAVKVIDFGVAKIKNSTVAESTPVALRVGTPNYLPPEQLKGEHAGAASDIYALGLVAYEMVTGRKPFRPESDYQILEMQRAHAMPPPRLLRPALPVAAEAALLKALRFNPQERYQRADDFGADFWQAVAEGETQLLHDDAPLERRTWFPFKRTARLAQAKESRAGWMGAMVILIAALALGVWFFVSRPSSKPRGKDSAVSDATSLPAESRLVLDYWREAQKFRGDNPEGKPFCVVGDRIFETNHRLRLHVALKQQGYLYIINESRKELIEGVPAYTLLFPDPEADYGSAVIPPEREVSLPSSENWFAFYGEAGMEKVWLIYAKQSISEIEAVRGAVNPNDRGAVKNQEQAAVIRNFLDAHADLPQRVEAEKDKTCPLTTVRGAGDVMLHLIKLEYR
ncbi:MAG TPA: serine/threonine-protein kinase [Pyrinomonadaceae bacterium]|jgi:serine/threonine protein kinase